MYLLNILEYSEDTTNDERFGWLKLDEFGKFACKAQSPLIFADILDEIFQTSCCQIDCYV